MRVLAIVLLLLAGTTEKVRAQSIGFGMTGGWGDGPVSSRAIGVDVHVGLPYSFQLLGEASHWGTAPGMACQQSIPESHACSVNGWSFTAGARWLAPSLLGALAPYVQAQGGRFAESPIPPREDHPRVGALEAGLQFSAGQAFNFGLGVRRVWVADEAYETAFDEQMRYTMLMARISIDP